MILALVWPLNGHHQNVANYITLRGLIIAKINFREFREFCKNLRKYVFAKYLKVMNSRKFVFAKYLFNTNLRKFISEIIEYHGFHKYYLARPLNSQK